MENRLRCRRSAKDCARKRPKPTSCRAMHLCCDGPKRGTRCARVFGSRFGTDPCCTSNAAFATLRNAETGPRSEAQSRFHQNGMDRTLARADCRPNAVPVFCARPLLRLLLLRQSRFPPTNWRDEHERCRVDRASAHCICVFLKMCHAVQREHLLERHCKRICVFRFASCLLQNATFLRVS